MLFLSACKESPSGFQATDVTGAAFGKSLSLRDHHGNMRHLEDFRGKLVVVFFGFTHCPDVCPTTLTQYSSVLSKLGADGEKVQVLFVTVDPERDTVAVLSRYVTAFNPNFLGMTGTLAEIQKVTGDFKVFFEKRVDGRAGAYSVDHTSASYVFDSRGNLRLLITQGQKLDTIAADLRALLSGR